MTFLPFFAVSPPPLPLPPDHHPDRAAENGPPPAIGARRQEAGPVLRVRRGRPVPPHVHLRPHCALACLHLVRRRETVLMHQIRGPVVTCHYSKILRNSKPIITKVYIEKTVKGRKIKNIINCFIFTRYAIGNVERNGSIGWLHTLGDQLGKHYNDSVQGTGGTKKIL